MLDNTYVVRKAQHDVARVMVPVWVHGQLVDRHFLRLAL